MPNVTIIRGDSYALRRPLYTYTLVDDENASFDLSGCTVRTTFKTVTTDPADDPTDASAALTGLLVVGSDGTPTTQTALYLVGDATAGTFEHRLTAAETAALPTGAAWVSDVELTDVNGEVFTWLFTETLTTVDGITNRTTG